MTNVVYSRIMVRAFDIQREDHARLYLTRESNGYALFTEDYFFGTVFVKWLGNVHSNYAIDETMIWLQEHGESYIKSVILKSEETNEK